MWHKFVYTPPVGPYADFFLGDSLTCCGTAGTLVVLLVYFRGISYNGGRWQVCKVNYVPGPEGTFVYDEGALLVY
jgi:hypothetical protein